MLAPTLTPTVLPTLSPLPASTPAMVTASLASDSGWQQLRPGLERRHISLADENGNLVETIYLLRLEPDHFRFGIAYQPQMQTLDAWQKETGALVVVNGGFFRQENNQYLPNGLTVVDGQASGSSYVGFGGMFAVSADGPELRWLVESPYIPGEPFLSALQSFPILVKPGGDLGFPEEFEDHLKARRTVVAQDRQGRFILLIASMGYFTLHRLSRYLVESDLELEIALNLDGGPSSGLLLSEPLEVIPAYSGLPLVITISTH